MKPSTLIALALVVLTILTVPAAAQQGPGEQRMNEMMTMMREMRADMQRMQEHMAAMHGAGGMEQMKTMMGRMQSMMEQHREQMLQHQCPALAPAPGGGKSGG
jgi:signal recognition particle GTPase